MAEAPLPAVPTGLGHVDIHSKRYKRRGELNEGQEVGGRFLVASRDAAVMLEPIQEPLNEVALFVLGPAVSPLNFAGFKRRDDDFRVPFTEHIQKGIGIVRLVGNDGLRLVIREDFLGTDQIVLLAGTE